MVRSALVAVIALGAALLLMAEDEGDPLDDVPPAGAVSGEQQALLVSYRRNAAQICDNALRVDELFRPTDQRELVGVLRLSIDASVRPTLQQLAELRPPERFRDHHDTMVAAGRGQLRVLTQLVDSVEGGNDARQAALDAAIRLDELQTRSNAAFKAMGVQRCVADVGPAQGER